MWQLSFPVFLQFHIMFLQLHHSTTNNFQCPAIHLYIVNTFRLLIEDRIRYLAFSLTLSIWYRVLDSISRSYPSSIIFLLKLLTSFSIVMNLVALYPSVTDIIQWGYTICYNEVYLHLLHRHATSVFTKTGSGTGISGIFIRCSSKIHGPWSSCN